MQDALSALVLNSEAIPPSPMNDTPPTPGFPAGPASDEHLMLVACLCKLFFLITLHQLYILTSAIL